MWQPTKACTLLCLSWFWLPVALAGVVGAAESATSLAPVSEVEGASECPCLTAISENKNGYNTVVDRLRSEGVNESKGTNGCQVYNADECNTYPLSCKQKWCYVDIEACKVNQRLCKEARGRRGSRASPHCRERPRYESKYVNDSSVLFSYETCGALGSYNETRFEKWMANLEVQAAVDPRKIYPNEMLQELVIKAFAKYSFLKSAARANASQMDVSIPILNVADQSYWKTPASTGSSCSQDEAGRFVCNSGYSNCVYDVAVGKLDLCIADMWITPGRSAIAQFLPPVRFDMFYLVQAAKPRTTEPTVGAIMERPFKPFTRWAWGAIGIFMLVSALCFLARRHLEEQSNQQVNETPPAARPGGSTSSLASRGHDLLDLIGGARSFASSNRASCKLVGFGFAWAMLVLTTTYTANLTDILAWERKQVTSLQRLKDAKNMSICVDQEAWSHFNLMYHELENVTWTPVKSSGDIPQLLHDDNCSAAVMYQEAIDSMHAGKFAGAGRPLDYDCKIRKVPSEEVLLTFAVGFPVVPPLVHGLSWALTSVLEEGTAAKAEIQHRTSLRGSFVTNCRVEEESEKGLDWSDVLGALIDAFIIITLGALIFVLRGQCCKRVSEPHTRSPRHPTSSAQPPFPIE